MNSMITMASRKSCARAAPSKKLIRYAAAIGTLSGASTSTWAFVTPSAPAVVPSLVRPPISSLHAPSNPLGESPSTPSFPTHQTTRLFFSNANKNNNNNENDDWSTLKRAAGNLVSKGVNKIKSIIPFGKSEEEKRAEMIKRERQEEITGGLSNMLKDMPLPIRMAGRMMAPILSNMAEEMAEQSRQAEDMLEEAQRRIRNDASLVKQLGEPLQVSRPFSQSSSTMIVNGKSSARVQASFQVVGPYGSGVATMDSSDGEIRSLSVNVDGRNISVGFGGSVYGRSSSTYGGKKVDNIIEAEIVDKK